MGPEGTHRTDGALVDQSRRHQQLRALYDDSVVEVYRYVLRRCLDPSLAEDITQDVFLAAVRSTDSADVTVGWLLRSARNRLIDVIRRSDTHARKLQLLDGAAGGRDESGVDLASSVADRVAVRRALSRLSPDHRIVLLLRYVDDLSIADLADVLDRPPRGVEALLTRARRASSSAMEEPA